MRGVTQRERGWRGVCVSVLPGVLLAPLAGLGVKVVRVQLLRPVRGSMKLNIGEGEWS